MDCDTRRPINFTLPRMWHHECDNLPTIEVTSVKILINCDITTLDYDMSFSNFLDCDIISVKTFQDCDVISVTTFLLCYVMCVKISTL